jgi:hypothetical protein
MGGIGKGKKTKNLNVVDVLWEGDSEVVKRYGRDESM